MRSRPFLRTLTILGLGVAGLIGGHALGYALTFPDIQHRYAVLDATGHGYIPSASWLAVVIGASALLTGVASGYRHQGSAPRLRHVLLPLIGLQAGAFVGLEVIERVLAAAPMETLSVKLLLIGVAVQIVVAVLVALAVAGLRRLGATLASRDRRVIVGGGLRQRVAVESLCVSSRVHARDRVRGPPVAVAV